MGKISKGLKQKMLSFFVLNKDKKKRDQLYKGVEGSESLTKHLQDIEKLSSKLKTQLDSFESDSSAFVGTDLEDFFKLYNER